MKRITAAWLMAALVLLGGCASRSGKRDDPALPEPDATPRAEAKASPGKAAADLIPARLERNAQGVPVLKVQAILARTFVMQFVTQKKSMYEGADISTDIKEAPAYDASGVNARIRQAVSETRGLVLNAGGELPYAWFHAHSGGLTARAKEGLDYEKAEPAYTQ